jgi:hypothetical protein
MDLRRLSRSEWIAMAGGLLLAVSLFLNAYSTTGPNAQIDGVGGPEAVEPVIPGEGVFSAWEVHDIMRWLLLAAAIAPFILAWIIIRDHELSWGRGELTAVVSIAAAGLIFYTGIIDRPGEPSGQIGLELGWYGMMLGSLIMLVGSVRRSTEQEKGRKPPGVL